MLIITVRALSKSQNWPAGPWPDQTFWQWNRLFPRGFAEKTSPLSIIFRVWLIWMVSFGLKWNSYQDGNGLAVQISSDKWIATLVCQGVKVFNLLTARKRELSVRSGWVGVGGKWFGIVISLSFVSVLLSESSPSCFLLLTSWTLKAEFFDLVE